MLRSKVPSPIFIPLAAILTIGFTGSLFHLWTTTMGIGVLHDSVFYLETARNLAEGKGLVWTGAGGELRPLAHFPPGYPLLLAPFVLTGIEPVSVARAQAALLFGLNVTLIGIAVWRSTGQTVPAFLASLLAALSPPFLGVHFMAMSEPQYLAAHMIGLILLIEYLGNRRIEFLIASAAASALAALTRYVGVATPFAGLAVLLLLYRTTLKRKLTDLAVFGFVGLGPSVLLAIRNNLASGAMTNRILIFNPIDYLRRRQAQDVVSQWLLPERFPYSVRVRVAAILLALILALVVWATVKAVQAARSRPGERSYGPMSMAWAEIIFAAVYTAILVGSAMFLDASTRWDDRILIPIFQSLLVISVISISYLTVQLGRSELLTAAGIAAAVGLAIIYFPQTTATARSMRSEGIGFTGSSWRSSNAVQWARELPSSTTMYSNEGLAVIFLTDLEPYFVPERVNPVTGEERQELDTDLQTMRSRLDSGGYLLLFHPDNLRAEMPSIEVLREGLQLERSFRDANVYGTR